MQEHGSLEVPPIPSFRNPPEADIRNPERARGRWMPDHGFAASGMTIIGLIAGFEQPTDRWDGTRKTS
jgi:hypothetical protein